MNLKDIMAHAEQQMFVYREAYTRNPNKGHSESHKFWRDVYQACKEADHLLESAGLVKRDGHG